MKRTLGLFFLVIISAMLLAGCGSEVNTPEDVTTTVEDMPAEDVQEDIKPTDKFEGVLKTLEDCQEKEQPEMAADCYRQVAAKEKDVTICDNIADDLLQVKVLCYGGVGAALGDESICDSLNVPADQPYPEAFINQCKMVARNM